MREVEKPAQRGLVGPVQVVDDQQRGLVEGEVGGDPVEAMQHRERRLRSLSHHVCRSRREQRRTELGGTCQQLGAEIRRRRGERRLEQLPHDPERELALELSASRGQHLELPRVGELPRCAQQPRLADPGGPLDDDQTTLTGAGRIEHRRQCGDLRLTLEHENRLSTSHLQLVIRHRTSLGIPSRGTREEGASGGSRDGYVKNRLRRSSPRLKTAAASQSQRGAFAI